MKNQTHTPTPWKIHGTQIVESNTVVADVYGSRMERIARRDLIVRAVNSHQALVEACEWALPVVVQWFNEKPHCQDHSGLTAMREALAAAKGEA